MIGHWYQSLARFVKENQSTQQIIVAHINLFVLPWMGSKKKINPSKKMQKHRSHLLLKLVSLYIVKKSYFYAWHSFGIDGSDFSLSWWHCRLSYPELSSQKSIWCNNFLNVNRFSWNLVCTFYRYPRPKLKKLNCTFFI